jgi:iron(III) transport system substrate-binding protein
MTGWSRWLSALLLLGGVAGCTRDGAPKKERLTLLCSVQHAWCALMAEEFEKETGIRVSMTRKGSGETLAQIRAERRNPRADVWWGGTGDAHLQAAEAGLTETYRSPVVSELHPWAVDPAGKGEHRTTGVYMGALGWGYNRDWLEKKGLPPPRSWAELVHPRYRGEIQMANPNSSGTAYTALATLLQLFGEEEGFRYLRALHLNVNQYTQSGAAPVRAAARGETGIGLVFLHDAFVEQAAGFPIEVVIPEEGTGFEIGCVSVLRGARHPEAARKFVDFALGPKGQEVGVRARAWQWPANTRAAAPPMAVQARDVSLIDFDHKRWGSRKERTRVLERWEREVRAGR